MENDCSLWNVMESLGDNGEEMQKPAVLASDTRLTTPWALLSKCSISVTERSGLVSQLL